MDEESADQAEVKLNDPEPNIEIKNSTAKPKNQPHPHSLEAAKDKTQRAPGQMLKDTFEPLDTKSKAPANPHQRRVMVFGLLLIVFGFIVWLLISFDVGLSVAAAGALVVAYGALVRL